MTTTTTQAAVLAALYNASRPLGMGMIHFEPAAMTEEEALALVAESPYFDYLKGRVMKVDVSRVVNDDGSINDDALRLFDRDNGPGAGRKAVEAALS